MSKPFVPDHLDCPLWGQGGRYVVIDGKRVPVVGADAAANTEPPAAQEAADASTKPAKGK